MSVEPFDVYIPCDVLAVKVTVGPADGLSVLEELFLKAVHAGIDQLDQLDRLFNLGARPTIDLVYDLWREGHLVLDFATGGLELTPKAREAAEAGDWSKLAGGERTEDEREVMLDLITGQLLELGHLRTPPTGGGVAIVPAGTADIRPSNVSHAELLAVLARMIDRENDRLRSAGGGRPRRVLAAGLALTDTGSRRGRRYLPVEVTGRFDEATGRLNVRVVKGADGLSPLARIKLVKHLSQFAEDQPDSNFVRYLRERAAKEIPSQPNFGELLARFTTKLDGLNDLNRGLVPTWHSELVELADPLEEICVKRSAGAVRTQVLVGHDAHLLAIRRLIQAAERQLVLVCPWVRYDGLQTYLADIQQALERGVQVFLVWGINRGDYDAQSGTPDLRPDSYAALSRLRLEYPHRFLFSQRSARTHAKLAIRDDRETVVSSLNFLAPSKEDVFEIGVVLTVAERGPGVVPPPPPSAATEAFLAWVRSSDGYPEYDIARLLMVQGDEFGPVALPKVDAASSRPPCPTTVAVSEGPAATLRDHLAWAAVRLWEAAWTEYRKRIAAFSVPLSTYATAVINGDHRSELWTALRTARFRLLLVSDQIGPEVVDDRFVRALEERLSAGALVSLVYRRVSASAQSPGVNFLERLSELTSRHPGRCRVFQSDTHAKVLIADDNVVIGSFNFLSFEGTYSAGGRYRQRSEVSVLLSGGGVADLVTEAVGQAIPEAVSGWPKIAAHGCNAPEGEFHWSPESDQTLISELADVAAAAGSNLTDAQEADAAAAAAVSRQLLEVVRGTKDPWQLLRRLSQARLDGRLLRRSVATVLTGKLPSESEEQQLLTWLLADSWRRRRYVEAAVLSARLQGTQPVGVPSPLVVRIAACQSVGTVSEDLWAEAVLTDGLSKATRATLAGAAAAELAARGGGAAHEALSELRSALPDAWRRVADAVLHYWGQAGAPLPTTGLDLQAAVESAWLLLQEALSTAEVKHFKFDSGSKTHHYLFAGEGPFARLRRSVYRMDASAVADWLAREKVTRLGDYLDDATRAASPYLQLIGKPVRDSYLKLLRSVFDAASALCAATNAAGGGEALRQTEGAREVARVVHQDWDALAIEANALKLQAPDAVLLDDLREAWRHLCNWGSQ